MINTEELPAITHVWSSFGHTFLSTGEYDSDGNPYEKCLTCGAQYVCSRREDDPSGGDYQASNGDDPTECTGRTDLYHGEAPCQADYGHPCAAAEDGPCEHEAHTHECNCLYCTG
ncbi:hypothetical protein [Streptomyces halobius]|uniref:TNFR-Cys domain-containing protein n=1 Tax=Streptomyces halobius TaxID=2879846 RepID=A0ABY4M5L1_9ACTN|nr:hypothetical protein [Streptomyces halobius]UQA91651.1 hypothetical protein K9S39_07050 [Streptomyces halobius]